MNRSGNHSIKFRQLSAPRILSAPRLDYSPERHKHFSATSVKRLLTAIGFSRQSNRKADEGSKHADRNAQFEHINAKVVAARRQASQSSRSTQRRKSWLCRGELGGAPRYPFEGAHRVAHRRRLGQALQIGHQSWVAVCSGVSGPRPCGEHGPRARPFIEDRARRG